MAGKKPLVGRLILNTTRAQFFRATYECPLTQSRIHIGYDQRFIESDLKFKDLDPSFSRFLLRLILSVNDDHPLYTHQVHPHVFHKVLKHDFIEVVEMGKVLPSKRFRKIAKTFHKALSKYISLVEELELERMYEESLN